VTLCVGIETESSVILVSDSYIGGEDSLDIMGSKIFSHHGIGFVHAGNARPGKVLEHHLRFRKPKWINPSPEEVEAWVIGDLTLSIQKCLHKYKSWSNKDDFDFYLLIAAFGYLFIMDSSFDSCRSEKKYSCIGAGADFAAGYIEALSARHLSAKQFYPRRLKKMMESVSGICTRVSPPWYVEEFKK
jgi:20S proteasome alpha/beta subunit